MAKPGTLDRKLGGEIERLKRADLYRQRRVVVGGHGVAIKVDGRDCINFCANDYLGLAADSRVSEAAQRALGRCGTGSGAAALISGYNAEHAKLEEELAAFVGRPRALLFSSGWAANLGVMRALIGRDDVLIADELNHASLIDGGRLSGASYQRVRHRDHAGFERALAAASESGVGRTTLVATDSVFSMDGDCADLPALATLCQQHDALLMVDDAHGFGVIGDGGRGSVFASDRMQVGPEIYVATLGKALGCAGAFVAGSESLIEFLIQRARTWFFSTATPPAMAAAARAALAIVQNEPERRSNLQANIQRLRAGAQQRGIPLMDSKTAIQPVLLGDADLAVNVSRRLFERGYWVAGIRPPTVPHGTARLRVTLSAAHTAQQIDGLLDALSDALPCESMGSETMASA